MKKCPQCKVQYGDLWRKCMQCHRELIPESQRAPLFKKKQFLKPDSSAWILEQLVEQANTLIIFTTLEGEALMCNEAIEFFTGYTRDEIFRQDWVELLHGGQQVRKEMFKAVMKGCLISVW